MYAVIFITFEKVGCGVLRTTPTLLRYMTQKAFGLCTYVSLFCLFGLILSAHEGQVGPCLQPLKFSARWSSLVYVVFGWNEICSSLASESDLAVPSCMSVMRTLSFFVSCKCAVIVVGHPAFVLQ